MDELPTNISEFIFKSVVAEYATVSSQNVPIDTPTYVFTGADSTTADLATGLAYPAKAERARRNPKVGLLFEGSRDEPVISIAGHAAVLDADLQANVYRYLSETGHMLAGGASWETAQRATWYWTRIIVSITPLVVRWWDNATSMHREPSVWRAPASTRVRESDPAPPGKASAPSNWPTLPWQQVAQRAVSRSAKAHLTLCDADGYPLPIGVTQWQMLDDGFSVTLPAGIPWLADKTACLTFAGLETFIGHFSHRHEHSHLRVDRALPMHPLMEDPKEVFTPSANTYDNLMRRLREETNRRGQPIPLIPLERPPPTRGALARMARQADVEKKMAGD